ncbi:MAG: acyltransferase family protein [Lachnospiraceae bacterium]|nr:acyltransferase family protein [Lachnospiraceae bacterium]
MEEKKRVQFIDMVKGITILCVALYHIIAPGMFRTFFAGIIGSLFFCFFFFSGYFYSPGKKTVTESIASRAKSLLIPFFSYSLTFWIIGSIILIIQGAETIIDALCCLRNFYAGSIWNRVIQDLFGWEYHSLGKNYPFLADFWFLPALFLASIVFIVIVEKISRTIISQFIAMVVLLFITGTLSFLSIDLPYNLQLIPFWAALVLLGYTCKLLMVFDRLKGMTAWVSGTLIAVISISVIVSLGYGTNLFRGTFEEPVIPVMIFLYINGFISIWGVSMVCKQIEDIGVNVSKIAFFGSHSIYLYMYHVFIAWLICRFTGFSMRYDPETVTVLTFEKSILLSLVSVTISILISVLAADKGKDIKVKRIFMADWEA